MRRTLALVVLAALLLSGLPSGAPRRAGASGGSTAGSSFLNCVTSEPSVNADPRTILCDDFDKGRDASNNVANFSASQSGSWYVSNCDCPGGASGGESNPRNKGWCANIFEHNTSPPQCSPPGTQDFSVGKASCPGANGTLCTAKTNFGGAASIFDALAIHNFPLACNPTATTAGGQSPSSARTGISCEYPHLFFRYYLQPNLSFWSTQFGTKMWTVTRCCDGPLGIWFGGLGFPNGTTTPIINPQGEEPNGGNPTARGAFDSQLCTSTGCLYLGHNVSGISFGTNNTHWYVVEFEVAANNAGTRNGIWRLWVDDAGVAGTTGPTTQAAQTLRANYTDVMWRATNICIQSNPCVSNATTLIGSAFQDTNSGNNDTSVGSFRIDQLVVSTARIGPMGASGSSPSPPAAPTNLHFGAWERSLMRLLGIAA